VADLRARGKRVVLGNGCFDLLHVGHLRYLEDARSRGDFLIIALNTDESIRALKGAGQPLVPLAERAELLLGLACVDRVLPFDELTLEDTLRVLRPDVHAKGPDYTPDTVPEALVDRELGIEIAICGDPKDHSSTELRDALNDTRQGSEPR
jgi:rfaE bifunctional protein nucleotidyltransferase chain/domain